MFCALGRRMLDQSFNQIQQGGKKIDEDLLNGILVQVWQGYADFNVAYHNDIHGFDVA